MLEVKNLKLYHRKNSIDIFFHKKCNILIGKNGTGKTTLLDYISGLVKKKETIITGNENLIYMNQSMFFFDRLNVYDVVKFVYRLDNNKQYKQTLESFNEKYYNKFDLKKIWSRQIGMLSGGEKKLLYFLLIMSLDRSWYLLDEPFAGVDEEGKELMCEVINSRISEHKGIIIVLHETEIINRLIDYSVINLDNNIFNPSSLNS